MQTFTQDITSHLEFGHFKGGECKVELTQSLISLPCAKQTRRLEAWELNRCFDAELSAHKIGCYLTI